MVPIRSIFAFRCCRKIKISTNQSTVSRWISANEIAPICLNVSGANAGYGTTRAAGGIPGGKRLEVVRDPLLLRVCYGERHHAPVTHPQHHRSDNDDVDQIVMK